MRTFDVPEFIQQPSGVFCLDILPALTLFPCCWTLNLFRKTQRYGDLVLFSFGFVLALVYHWCQMYPGGLEQSIMFDVGGNTWRTFDVLFCPILLTRTFGHIFGTTKIPLRILPDVFFPSILLSLYLFYPKFEESFVSNLALGTMLITASCVVLFYGRETIPCYRPLQGGMIFFALFLSAFFLFLPNLCGKYWLFHSLWHLFLALGYYTLYYEIEQSKLTDQTQTNGKKL